MNSTVQIGDITIHRIVEQQQAFSAALDFLPTLTAECLAENRPWLAPRALDEADRLVLCFQSYVIRTPHHTVLVDSCIGNDKDRPARPTWHRKTDDAFIGGLAAVGLSVEDIDVVMCTHLHADHVGWNTRLQDGSWVPTFPRARYLFSARELEYWTAQHAETPIAAIEDSVLPIVAANRAELVSQRPRARRPYPPAAHPGPHARPFRRAPRPRPGRGGADRRPDPLAAAGALSGAVHVRRHRPARRPRTPAAAFLEHYCDTATLCCTAHFPSPSAGLYPALGRRVPLRERGGLTPGQPAPRSAVDRKPAEVLGRHDRLADRPQRQRRQLQMRPGERNADDGDGQQQPPRSGGPAPATSRRAPATAGCPAGRAGRCRYPPGRSAPRAAPRGSRTAAACRRRCEKAARAQGRPMMVIARMTAAISQPIAIQSPPVTIQSTLSSRLTGDIGVGPRAGVTSKHGGPRPWMQTGGLGAFRRGNDFVRPDG